MPHSLPRCSGCAGEPVPDPPISCPAVPPPDFDLVARPYRWLEYLSFGPYLARCRFAQLPHLMSARRALVFGDGDGRFLARLLRLNPQLHADAVDASPRMLALLRRRIARAGAAARVRTHGLDALEFNPRAAAVHDGAAYDLVVTHFFLDCFTPPQIERLAAVVVPACAPDACWLISEFQIPAHRSRLAVLASRLVVAALYRAFALLTGLRVRHLPDYAPILRRHGFELESHPEFLGGLLRSQLWRRGGSCNAASSPRF